MQHRMQHRVQHRLQSFAAKCIFSIQRCFWIMGWNTWRRPSRPNTVGLTLKEAIAIEYPPKAGSNSECPNGGDYRRLGLLSILKDLFKLLPETDKQKSSEIVITRSFLPLIPRNYAGRLCRLFPEFDYAFCSIFQALQDLHTFASLET